MWWMPLSPGSAKSASTCDIPARRWSSWLIEACCCTSRFWSTASTVRRICCALTPLPIARPRTRIAGSAAISACWRE
jgi:hypothetical protein